MGTRSESGPGKRAGSTDISVENYFGDGALVENNLIAVSMLQVAVTFTGQVERISVQCMSNAGPWRRLLPSCGYFIEQWKGHLKASISL